MGTTTTSRAGAVGVGALVLFAGCTGTLVEFSSAPATLPQSALDLSDYEAGNTTEVPITYRIGGAGVSRDITAQTWISGYLRSSGDDSTAVLLLYSSPDLEVAGQSVNPLGQLSNRELIRTVLDRLTDLRGIAGVSDLSGLDEVGARDVTILGMDTQLVSYEGMATIENDRVEIVLNIAAVPHEDDIVVALGMHEDALDESDVHAQLVERVEHGR